MRWDYSILASAILFIFFGFIVGDYDVTKWGGISRLIGACIIGAPIIGCALTRIPKIRK